jgi:hypothetical protein
MYKSEIIRQVAKLHHTYIKNGFISGLGSYFLELIYTAIDRDPSSILIVEFDAKNNVIGFISGTNNLKSVFWHMLRHPIKLMFALIPSAFDLKIIQGISNIIRKSVFKPKANSVSDLPNEELLSVAVSLSHRGNGTADKLYYKLCCELKKTGADSFHILVGDDLLSAHKYYLRMGAKPILKTELHKGASSTIYLQVIDNLNVIYVNGS